MERYAASKLILLPDQKEEWLCRLRMIREAQRFLYISTYYLHYDRYGHEYVEALLAARRRGVAVTLLIDDFGQRIARNLMTAQEIREGKEAIQRLKQEGASVIFYRCRSPLQRCLGSGMHIKIQLADTGGALFASGNIAATSYEQWREFSVYVEGSIVLRLLKEFSLLGVPVDTHHEQYLQSTIVPGNAPLYYLSYNPVDDPHPFNPWRLAHRNFLTDYLENLFADATRKICLTSFYFKPAPALMTALVDAAGRGVEVEIFHSHRDALEPTIIPWLPSYCFYPALLAHGVKVYENRRGEHSKIILIDGKTAVFGSYNLEHAAHERVAEAMMASSGESVIAAIENLFKSLRASADNVCITDSFFKELPAHIHWKAQCLKPFMRWI